MEEPHYSPIDAIELGVVRQRFASRRIIKFAQPLTIGHRTHFVRMASPPEVLPLMHCVEDVTSIRFHVKSASYEDSAQ